MSISVIGMNHRTAPLEIRERLTWPLSEVPGVLRETLEVGGTGGVLLTTCNRTEFYLADPTSELLDAVWARAEQRIGRSAVPYSYVRHERDVAGHLFRVTAGLDSMVLGESQIQGQVRDAWELARPVAGPVLNRLFQAALRAGGRVRAETGIGHGPGSVPTAAVDLARKIFGNLAGHRALVLGSGEMAELAMSALVSEGIQAVLVAHRNVERARDVAAKLGGRAIEFDEAWPMFETADVVICSTAAPHAIVTADKVAPYVARREGRPLCVLDIAVPRDADPALGELNGVFLYDIDDLQGVVASGVRSRTREVPAAERIVDQELGYFWNWYAGRTVVGAIRSFRERMDELRRHELEKALHDLTHLAPEDRARVAHLTKALMNKFLHEPTVRLRRSAIRGQEQTLTEAVEELFDLRDDDDDEDA